MIALKHPLRVGVLLSALALTACQTTPNKPQQTASPSSQVLYDKSVASAAMPANPAAVRFGRSGLTGVASAPVIAPGSTEK